LLYVELVLDSRHLQVVREGGLIAKAGVCNLVTRQLQFFDSFLRELQILDRSSDLFLDLYAHQGGRTVHLMTGRAARSEFVGRHPLRAMVAVTA
jgi:hypothetical protein